MIGLAVLAGFGFAGGICLLVAGLRPSPAADVARRSWSQRVSKKFEKIDRKQVWIAIGLGMGVAVVTRWPVAALGAAVFGWFVPLPGARAVRDRNEARTEAIALWTEMLRDAAGTSRGIEGMLAATASSSPLPIRADVQRMARRLEYEPLAIALDGLAADLAHPIGDLVVTALRLASTAGSRRVRQVLDDLAVAAHQEASMHRRVDVARQRPRTTMRLVAVIVGLFVAGMLIFARTYLAAYGTTLGQLVLAIVAIYWALGFWWMAKMGRLPQVERFLATSGRRP